MYIYAYMKVQLISILKKKNVIFKQILGSRSCYFLYIMTNRRSRARVKISLKFTNDNVWLAAKNFKD